MSERRQPYSYLVLRYRHDPLAGEQVNVGVVLLAPENRFIGARFRKTYSRLSKIFPDLDGASFRRDLEAIERAFQKLAATGKNDMFLPSKDILGLAQSVVGKDDGSLIWSEIGSGLTGDQNQTLESLYSRFVTRYDESGGARRSDADVWKPFRDRLVERRVSDIFQSKTISSSRDEVEFEHAWKNGKWHCFQPLSFDLASVESVKDKAARWVGHMVGLKSALEEFQCYFIIGAPTDQSLSKAYDRALEFISEAPQHPRVITEDQFDAAADELARQIREHPPGIG